MAQLDKYEKQSFLFNEIKEHIKKGGGNVTHVLNVEISRSRSAEEEHRIREAICNAINHMEIVKTIRPQLNVRITWRTSALPSSAYYYHCDVRGMWSDIAVKEHTNLLLKDLLTELDGKFDNIFADGVTGVNFFVTKPLSRERALI